MSSLTEKLDELHDAVATQLLAKVNSGQATAAELQAAIKFLKDNDVVVDDPSVPGSAVGELGQSMSVTQLPFPVANPQ